MRGGARLPPEDDWLRGWMRDHGDAILRYLYASTHDVQAAEDLAQEVFFRLYRQHRRHPFGTIHAGWLYTVARRLAIDFHRRQQRELSLSQSPAPAAEPTAAHWEMVVRSVLDTLPVRDRELLDLFYWADWSIEDLARHYHTTPAAVRGRLFRARELFRRRWTEEEEHDAATHR